MSVLISYKFQKVAIENKWTVPWLKCGLFSTEGQFTLGQIVQNSDILNLSEILRPVIVISKFTEEFVGKVPRNWLSLVPDLIQDISWKKNSTQRHHQRHHQRQPGEQPFPIQVVTGYPNIKHLFLPIFYFKSIKIRKHNKTHILKPPKNQNRRAALGRSKFQKQIIFYTLDKIKYELFYTQGQLTRKA